MKIMSAACVATTAFLALAGTLAVEASIVSDLDSEATRQIVVGEPIEPYCCIYGSFTSCLSKDPFICTFAPNGLVCGPATETIGGCTAAVCDEREYMKCEATEWSYRVDKCKTTGQSTADGCAKDYLKCVVAHTPKHMANELILVDLCVAGSALCPSVEQPKYPCN